MNAFTVDVEDYFQVTAFERQVSRKSWDSYPSRVVPNTRRLLALLEAHEIKGTFFVLGWVAARYPELVREIHRAGHEVASHGYWHRLVYEQTPDEFRRDICDARDELQSIIGEPVTAYRAPSFSITERSLWALPILVEEGFRVDSSLFPVRHDRYGIPNGRREIHQITTPAGALTEFPPTVVRIICWNLAVGGGGYFRLYPLPFTQACLARHCSASGQPFMFYIHPWEVDPDQPVVQAGSRLSYFRHRVNLGSTERKLERLFRKFAFGSVGNVIMDSERATSNEVS